MVKVSFRKLVRGSLLKIESGGDTINFSVYGGGIYYLNEILNLDGYVTLSPEGLRKFLGDYDLDIPDLFALLEQQ